MRRYLLVLATAAGLHADSLEPRASPKDFPVSRAVAAATLGAELHGRGATAGRRHWVTDEFLAVEVAVYPAAGQKVPLRHSDFILRINFEKPGRLPASPQQVAAQIRNPVLSQRRGVEVAAGPVIIGRPTNTGRFPGDPTVTRPVPRPAPTGLPEKNEEETPDYQHAIDTALPTGEARGPTAGFLYFPFAGNLKKAKNIALEWTCNGETAVLKLR